MADKTNTAAEGAAAASGGKKAAKKGGALGLIFFMIVFGAAAPFIMPTMTLFLIGMIPTFVTLLTDNDRHKSSTVAVAYMNAAGVTPFVIDLWTKGQHMGDVVQILAGSTSWVVILGAAAVGRLIAFAVPQTIALLSSTQAEARLKLLRKNLDTLKENWGADVGTTKPIDKIEGGA